MKVNSLHKLKILKDENINNVQISPDAKGVMEKKILVCGGTGCLASQGDKIIENLIQVIKDRGYEEKVKVVKTGCFGFCEQGPIVKIEPDDVFYVKVNPTDAESIIDEHIIKGSRLERLLYEEPIKKEKISKQEDMPFYKKQHRLALKNCGLINPEDIYEYIAFDGYKALGKVIAEMTKDEVVEEIKKSGLRGRGGGGFPTGMKWEFTYQSESNNKYVVCNADEGDPGAFMDRSILEGDPHSVIEAMAIAGYTVGAQRGIVYIRAEYPLAIERLTIALNQAREMGFLGNDIFDSSFNFDIELKLGAGAFVCGEQTALINSAQGLRGEPNSRPPHPYEEGLWNCPTNVNNVETYANIPPIILNGAEWFTKIGTENSKGTKVFALGGKINNVGLVEVPMGTTLREVVFNIGGGIPNNKKFKAVQTGGPSGGVVTEKYLDTPIDYENLQEIGSMMGSGGMIVLDEDNCMPSIAKFYMEFIVDESCGKCTPCREGTLRLYEILERIVQGEGTMEDLDTLRELGDAVQDASLCGLGKTAANPVLSTLNSFYDEYLAHVVDKSCPSGQCKELLSYIISPEKCIGCTACSRVCPPDAISGNKKEAHSIDKDKCIKCGACLKTCKFDAILIK